MSTRTTSGFSEIPRDAAPSFSSSSAYRRHPLLFWVGGIFATLIAALFIASFFLDDMIRVRTQVAMNQKLKGYHVALAHAHRVEGNQPKPHFFSFLWTEGAGTVGAVRPAPLYRHLGVCHQVQVPIGGLVAAAE